MRLTTVILLASLLQVSAASFAQRITLREKNAQLETIFKEIRKQSGYNFFYDGKAVTPDYRVSVAVKDATIEETLRVALKGLPFSFEIQENGVTIRKVAGASLPEVSAGLALIDVRGKVVDEKGQPLAGATVLVKGSEKATKTGSDGRFMLTGINSRSILVVSFIGYKALEFAVKEDVGILVLELEENSLEQVKVIAYGTVKEKFNTGNVSAVSGQAIKDQPVSNPLVALQGMVPGLFINQTNGLSTGGINVTVQGRNSLNNGNQPFFVIDGIPLVPNAIGGNVASTITQGSISNLNYLNPSEIESITVLKDADATAIYGSRAANGAILITTKKGKAGQTKVELGLQNGWGKIANPVKLLNTDQYITIRKEAYTNAGMDIPSSAVDINGIWDAGKSFDWQKELLNEQSLYQNIQASVSGGSENTQFLAGVGYNRETPVFKGDFSNVRTSVNFNVNHLSTNKKFRFFLSGSYLKGDNTLPVEDITLDVINLAPNYPGLYNADGSINWAPVADIYPFQSARVQPASKLTARYRNQAGNLSANSNLSYEIVPGLNIKSSLGFSDLQNDESALFPFSTISPQDRSDGAKPSASFSQKKISSWIVEPQLTYTKDFNGLNIEGLLGATFQSNRNKALFFRGDDYSNDAQLEDFSSAGRKTSNGSLVAIYNYAALFGRINLRLRDKYVLNFTARRDGSSRFGSENLFQTFYSAGGAWLFSEEDFLSSTRSVLNYGKLKVSYGTTGNDQIGDYSFYSLYNSENPEVPYAGVPALTPGGLSNPYLQWEQTRKFNMGIDLGFYSGRILLGINYFLNRSSNQLLQQDLPYTTGFGIISRNLPATVQNTGLEIMLDYTAVKGKDFKWQGSFNITLPKNKLLKYDGWKKQVMRTAL